MAGGTIMLLDVFAFDFRAGMDENDRFRRTLHSTGLRRFGGTLAARGVYLLPTLLARGRQ